MVVVSVSNCPMQLRGDLTKWLQEIDVGVYVGNLSARVRNKIWERVCDNIKSGRAIMVYSTNNEQGYAILTHNTERIPKDYDGLLIMFRHEKRKHESTLKKGFSKVAKYEMARRQKKLETRINEGRIEGVILDVETTGLDCSSDSIVEVGLLRFEGDTIKEEYQSLIKVEEELSGKITALTGITQDMVNLLGKNEREVLEEIKIFIGDSMVMGYNVQFDINFINKLCSKYELPIFIKKYKDVMKMARRKLDLDNYKLETVCNYYGMETTLRHRAIKDCTLVYGLLKELNEIT